LRDPDEELSWAYPKNVLAFEQISNLPCLVFLGEPGIGKSIVIHQEYNRIKEASEQTRDVFFFKNLNQYGNEDRLIRDVFDSDVVAMWKHQDSILHIFLDSLDECRLQLNHVAKILQAQFQALANFAPRLRLRIACRTAEWPSSLEISFAQLWEKKDIGIFELVPLRQKDITEAARMNHLDNEAFLDAIAEKEAQPLAMKPVTLQMLLNLYSEQQRLPDRQDELYQKGCEWLCKETNRDRRDAFQTGRLSPERRIALASRIAAVMVLCNRISVCLDVNVGSFSESDLRLSDLTGGKERINSDTFHFTEDDLKKVCETGLFTGFDKGRVTFAHKTYSDFLASRYLMMHEFPTKQIMHMLQSSEDDLRMVVPQLEEVAAWLAGMNSEIFQSLVDEDPQILLKSDVAKGDHESRQMLVQSLLDLMEAKKITDRDLNPRVHYKNLWHPTLASQLKPHICEKGKHFLVRRVAINIAEACGLTELQDILAEIALDRGDALDIRIEAAHAVAKIGDEDTRLCLKSLALEPQDDDIDDRLKGHALKALWPGLISTQELFDCLTPPKNENLIGSYAIFLSYIVPENLSTNDLPIALDWVAKQPQPTGMLSRFERLDEHILFMAWKNLANEEILEAFADAAIPRLRNYLSICPIPGFGVTKKAERPPLSDVVRKKLIISLISRLGQGEDAAYVIAHPGPPLITSNDLYWMVGKLLGEKEERIKATWATLIRFYFDPNDQDHFEAVYSAKEKCRILAKNVHLHFGPIELNSVEANRMKAHYEITKKNEEERKQREEERVRPIRPSPDERLADCLNRFEQGDLEAWWQLCLSMTLEPTSKFYDKQLQSDLRTLPGWTNSDEATRGRIIEAAKEYVRQRDAAPSKWLGTNILHHPATAGYKALILLQKVDREFVDSLTPQIWAGWIPILLGYPEPSGLAGQDETYIVLIGKAYQHAPAEVLSILMQLIARENEEGNTLFILRKMKGCWDKRLCAALFEKCKDRGLKPRCFGELLSELVAHEYLEAEEFAKSLLKLPLPNEVEEKERSKAAALALLAKAKDAAWDVMWPAIQADKDFGHDVLIALPGNLEERQSMSLAERIGEENTANLFIWLMREFPPEEYSQPEGVHWVEPRVAIANYRDGLVEQLKTFGTPAAIRAIKRIKRELPDLEYIDFVLVTARQNMRRKNWTPHLPKDFIQLAQRPDSRIVLSSEDLMHVVMEFLKSLQKKLHGETPESDFLWNNPSSDNPKPRAEEALSRYIKNRLMEDLERSGIIGAREVKIRTNQAKGGESGELIDLYVSCFVPSIKKHVRVIVEVKGCWHKEVKTAMKDQLANRYLKDKEYKHGIYLVGWFDCPEWKDKESIRRRQGLTSSIEDERAYYDQQARGLSQNELVIKAFVLDCSLR